MAGTGNDTGWIPHLLEILGAGAGVQLLNIFLGRKKADAEARKFDQEGDAAFENSINEHMKTLMEGFKTRIDDLQRQLERQERDCREREDRMAKQITALQGEVIALRRALDNRPKPGPTPFGI